MKKLKYLVVAAVGVVLAGGATYWLYTDGDRHPSAQRNLRNFDKKRQRQVPQNRWDGTPWP
ncbi:hypothetical protein HYX70_01305 [Candidatus Saccharibacteria bacterium]|nr:hypothetical protein [Candidatus Saccharibacteria bacterium]